jgi:hypothetical protein
MKKLALTNLMFLMAIKSVSACTPAGDPNSRFGGSAPTGVFDQIFFFASFGLLLPIVILFFLRKRKGLWTIILSILSLVLFIPAIFIVGMFEPCGQGDSTSYVIKGVFFLMLLFFTFQIVLWISQRKTPLELR